MRKFRLDASPPFWLFILKRTSQRCLFYLLMAVLVSVSFSSESEIKPGTKVKPSFSGNKLCLVLIDFDSFFCSPCLQYFLNFCQAIPDSVQEKVVKGVLVYTSQKENERSIIRGKIIERKLQGFIHANQIKFPVVLDHFHIFNDLAKEGSVAVIFDQERKVVKKYRLPLRQEQLDEVLNYLLN